MTATHWYVITGAPSSGKTTLLAELEKTGYHVVHEVARTIIESELARGRTLQQIRADKKSFENRILEAKIALEARLAKNEVIFLDRGVPDSIAYFKISGLDPAIAWAKSRPDHYRKVFLLDRLPFQKDHVRIEESATAAELERALEMGYRELGYAVQRINVMPVADRLKIILDALGDDRYAGLRGKGE
jgi:predicted ATPase